MIRGLPRILCALSALLAASSWGQEFPEGSTMPSGSQIKERLSDRVLDAKLADGSTWRLEYKANGYFFIDTSRGFRSDGQWSSEDGKLCSQLRGRDRSCNDVRLHQDVVHLKRDSGEIIRLVPR